MRRLLRVLPDKLYICLMYFKHFKRFPNLKNPKTFNEKLQWLKLHDRKPEYTTMVDKHLVKEYVAKKLGKQYVIATLGVWNSADQIDFDALPDRFVLKCNHDGGSSSVIICRDKKTFDKQAAIEQLNSHRQNNGYWYGREWLYKNVKPCIIAEAYLEDTATKELRDYKFFCFDGKVKCFKIDFNRFVAHRANYYDHDGNLLPFGEAALPPDYEKNLEMPKNIAEMIALAEKLSEGHPFLRVDFYSVNGVIYFGELTFYPASGFGSFTQREWDETLGRWIQLPQ